MKISYEDILGGIVTMTDIEKLRRLNTVLCDRIKDLRTRKNRSMRFEFESGDKVSFTGRRGLRCEGTIEAMGPQRAEVRTHLGVVWRVPYSMLTPVKAR